MNMNKAQEIQESKEERGLLRSNTRELLYSKNFMLFKVLLCLIFVWTLIQLFDAQDLTQSVVNVCVLMIISAVFSLKIAHKQFSNHKILFKAITKNTPIIVQSTLYLLAIPIAISILMKRSDLLEFVGILNQDSTINNERIATPLLITFFMFGVGIFIYQVVSTIRDVLTKKEDIRVTFKSSRYNLIIALYTLTSLLSFEFNIFSPYQNLALLLFVMIAFAAKSLGLFCTAIITSITAITLEILEKIKQQKVSS